jgi:hypothetical protein
MKSKLLIFAGLLVVNLLAGAMVLMGQDTPPPPSGAAFADADAFNAGAVAGQRAIIEGTLNTVFGDPRSPLDAPTFRATIYDSQGEPIVRLLNPSGEVLRYHMQPVRVSGQVAAAGTSADAAASFSVDSIQVDEFAPQADPSSGPQPFANILCKFSNVAAEPKSQATIQGYFANNYPNLDHYFRDMSYGAITLVGTTTTSFVTIGNTATYLAMSDEIVLDEIAQDCATAAEAQVNYADMVGLNLMLNVDLFGAAFGGSTTLLLDGVNRPIRVTWNPPWAQTFYVLGHEMGHAFGMPHSTGPSVNPPSGRNVYVSAWDVMSDAAGMLSYWPAFAPPQNCPEFTDFVPNQGPNCVAQGMIAAQLLYPGWLPVADAPLVNRGTTASVLLERVRQQPVGSNDLAALIPTLFNSSLDNFFYTVELREESGYDTNNMTNITGSAWTTLIHFVDTRRNGQDGQPLIVTKGNSRAINGPAAQWLAGDSFVDVARNVTINIIAREGSAVRVNIGNNIARPANDAIAAATPITALPFAAAPDSILATQALTDPGLSCLGGNQGFYTLWYRYTAPATRFMVASTLGSSTNTALAVFSGTPTSLTPVGCNDDFAGQTSELMFSVQAGLTYYIAVAGNGSSSFGPLQFSLIQLPDTPTRNRFPTGTPTLTWSPVSGTTVTYDLQISTVSTFASLVYNQPGITSTSHPVSLSLAEGLYYWRVQAVVDGVRRPWSAVDTFVVDIP